MEGSREIADCGLGIADLGVGDVKEDEGGEAGAIEQATARWREENPEWAAFGEQVELLMERRTDPEKPLEERYAEAHALFLTEVVRPIETQIREELGRREEELRRGTVGKPGSRVATGRRRPQTMEEYVATRNERLKAICSG